MVPMFSGLSRSCCLPPLGLRTCRRSTERWGMPTARESLGSRKCLRSQPSRECHEDLLTDLGLLPSGPQARRGWAAMTFANDPQAPGSSHFSLGHGPSLSPQTTPPAPQTRETHSSLSFLRALFKIQARSGLLPLSLPEVLSCVE